MGIKIHTRIWAGEDRVAPSLPLILWNLFIFLLKQSAAHSPSKRKKRRAQPIKLEKTKAMPCQFTGIDLSMSLLQCAQAKNGTNVSPDQNKQGRGLPSLFKRLKN